MTAPAPGRFSITNGCLSAFAEMLADDAGVDVGRSAGAERHDDLDRSGSGSPGPTAGAASPAAAARMSASFTNGVNCKPSEFGGMLEQSAVLSSRQALRPKESG